MKKGAILSYFSMFISILIALIYTPIMIRLLGQSEYGLYTLIGSIAAYFSILDLGLGNSIVRYISRNRAVGDKQEESKLNGLFLLLYSCIGLLTIIIGIVFYASIDKIFTAGLNESEILKAKIMTIILIFNFSISFPLSIFESILKAYEKFVVVKIVEIIRIIAMPSIILPLLLMGYGSIAMVVVTVIVNISCLLFNMFYSFNKLDIKIYFGRLDLSLIKEILGYSFFVFLAVIVDQVYWKTDQFILGAILGTIPVAIYGIAMQFINMYMRFSTSISSLFLPKASMMVAKNSSNNELTKSMIKYGRIQYIIMAYILTGFILFGRQFINFWAGNNYDDAYFIVLIIMVPFTIPLIQNFGLSILYAKNLQKFRSVMLIIIAIFNIIITIPLVINYGGIGAAFGTAISMTVGNIIIMNIYYHKRIGIDIPLFWSNIIKMSLPIAISLCIGFLVELTFDYNNILLVTCKIFFYSLVYFFLMWNFGFNSYEKSLFKSILNRFGKSS